VHELAAVELVGFAISVHPSRVVPREARARTVLSGSDSQPSER